MRQDETISTKLFRYFFHIRGVLDKEARQQMNAAIAKAFLFMWLYILVFNGCVLLFAKNSTGSGSWLLFVYLSLLIGVGGTRAANLHLDVRKVTPNQYDDAVEDAVIGSVWVGFLGGVILFAVWMNASPSDRPFPGIFAFLFLVVACVWEAREAISHIVVVESDGKREK
ncbi:DUF3278 domain-containing protein [Lentilactobacillus parakefiri]|uniref:DUF3278 domain-containing protein n=1 Tax=Lentilactobacillus parakefiri TaxID=152332 RepID=A0A269Y1G0_9LACO|nr:DUF3278 domain-containing protein [Lentilactobacillus parakefiri]PAK78486.1 hypothetical protein B8W98_10060 [Lentilactobacillus parakefiri]